MFIHYVCMYACDRLINYNYLYNFFFTTTYLLDKCIGLRKNNTYDTRVLAILQLKIVYQFIYIKMFVKNTTLIMCEGLE